MLDERRFVMHSSVNFSYLIRTPADGQSSCSGLFFPYLSPRPPLNTDPRFNHIKNKIKNIVFKVAVSIIVVQQSVSH